MKTDLFGATIGFPHEYKLYNSSIERFSFSIRFNLKLRFLVGKDFRWALFNKTLCQTFKGTLMKWKQLKLKEIHRNEEF